MYSQQAHNTQKGTKYSQSNRESHNVPQNTRLHTKDWMDTVKHRSRKQMMPLSLKQTRTSRLHIRPDMKEEKGLLFSWFYLLNFRPWWYKRRSRFGVILSGLRKPDDASWTEYYYVTSVQLCCQACFLQLKTHLWTDLKPLWTLYFALSS